ncbi:MAG: HAD-IA family hydrolase [Candidatus Dojkabacteria bacterium]|nr:HAD-IA family hydrolase [Candidatus Dojkabacteria bacterium]
MIVKGIVFDFYDVLYDSSKHEINKDVLEIVKILKNKFKLYLFTNSSKEFLAFNDKQTQFLDLFLIHITTIDCNCHKPDEESFKILFEETDIEPKDTIFIDDKAENIKEAKKYGFNTIQYEDIKLLKDNLKRYNIDIGV